MIGMGSIEGRTRAIAVVELASAELPGPFVRLRVGRRGTCECQRCECQR
jgi:hypothetical protein